MRPAKFHISRQEHGFGWVLQTPVGARFWRRSFAECIAFMDAILDQAYWSKKMFERQDAVDRGDQQRQRIIAAVDAGPY